MYVTLVTVVNVQKSLLDTFMHECGFFSVPKNDVKRGNAVVQD